MGDVKKRVCVLSFGSFAIALSKLLDENGHDVTILARSEEKVQKFLETRKHPDYLKNIYIPESIKVTSNIEEAAKDREVFISATPSSGLRNSIKQIAPYINESTIIVNAAKGIENGTLLQLSEVIKEVIIENSKVKQPKIAVLSGPGHAEEIALGLPTTYVVASIDNLIASQIQNMFMNCYFRIYKNHDVLGVELGGALKNVIALSAGISDGMGYGDNAKAALMTRGIAEIARLGVAMGAEMSTFGSLSGIGDLIVTCTSEHSRNRRAGILLGKGMSLKQTLEEINMTVEGIHTAKAAFDLSQKYNVEMPIIKEINLTLFHGKLAKDTVNSLMNREKKSEVEDY